MICIALDDEPMALEVIKSHCEQSGAVSLVKCFTQASKAKSYIKKHPVDCIFLDIQMPDISGTDFYQSIERDIMVVFTTAHSNYAVKGFELNAVDYLLKPIRFARFEQAVQKAIDLLDYRKNSTGRSRPFFFVRSNHRLVKIVFDEVLYFKKEDDYIRIERAGDRPVYTLMSMKSMMTKLPTTQFIRVHRSYSVNVHYIKEKTPTSIILGDIEIPIGKTFRGHLDL